MAGLLDGYGIDPMAMGLLGAGGALLTPRQQGGGIGAALQAFPQGMMQGQEMQRRLRADAQRQEALRQEVQMRQSELGMRQERFGFEKEQYAAEQKAAQMKAEFDRKFLEFAQQKDPEIALLFGVDRKAAVERAFPKAEWRTFFGADGRQTQGFVTPGQAPVPVGGSEIKRERVQLGDRVEFVDPLAQAGPLTMGQSPDSKASIAAQLRGQDLVSARAREATAAAAGTTKATDWVYDPARGGFAHRMTQEFKPATQDGVPIGAKDPGTAAQKAGEAREALALLDQADKLIDQSTGSYLGVGIDKAAQAFGAATPGAQAAAQLRALEGALIAKMPKMSGPQSDKDVLLYKQMAGQIGDPTIPAATKKAALRTIREIQDRASGMSQTGPAGLGTGTVSGRVGGATGGWSIQREK
jgi:hypothetical protein